MLAALHGVHHDTGHQSQQRMSALAQEGFWWPMMAENCKGLVRGCPRSHAFEGAVPQDTLCPIRAHMPLELVHVDFTSVESTMELNKPLSMKNVLVITNHFMCYTLAIITKDQMAKTVVRVLYERFITIFSTEAKLLSDRKQNLPRCLWKSCVLHSAIALILKKVISKCLSNDFYIMICNS